MVELNGAWYYLKDGVALTNTLEEIDGSYYYFNDEGVMVLHKYLNTITTSIMRIVMVLLP
mgnify:CR=1 FL=1